MKKRYDAEATQRLVAAIREVESRSCAELVLEIQARSGSYAHADARFGALLSFLSLVALLFLPATFPAYAVLVDAAVFYFIGLFVSSRSSSVRRLMTTKKERAAAVRGRAAALFYERGLANTTGETGLLLFVSLLERQGELIADRGLLRMMPPEQWNSVHNEVRNLPSVSPDDVVAVIAKLASILHVCAPAGTDNPDELTSTPLLNLT